MAETGGIRRYQETAVNSLGPERLIVMLYEGLLRYLRLAGEALAAGKRTETARRLAHAQAVILELRNTLDHEIGGALARNLDALYEYVAAECLRLLEDDDPRHLANCERVLSPLLRAWSAIPPGAADRALRERAAAPRGLDPARATAEASAAPMTGAQPQCTDRPFSLVV